MVDAIAHNTFFDRFGMTNDVGYYGVRTHLRLTQQQHDFSQFSKTIGVLCCYGGSLV
jgi:hypothetical protein